MSRGLKRERDMETKGAPNTGEHRIKVFSNEIKQPNSNNFINIFKPNPTVHRQVQKLKYILSES